jgi:hypothetical protein
MPLTKLETVVAFIVIDLQREIVGLPTAYHADHRAEPRLPRTRSAGRSTRGRKGAT